MGKPKLPWTTCVKCGGLKVRRKHGSGWWCPPCKQKYTAGSRARWKLAKPTRWRVYLLKMKCRNYGITAAIFAQAYKEQEYKCAACREDLPVPHIDHDHVTGKFRGLLCRRCNLAMYVVDNPFWLSQLAQYKEKH